MSAIVPASTSVEIKCQPLTRVRELCTHRMLSYSLDTGNSFTAKSTQQVNAALTLRQTQNEAAQSKILQTIIATLIAKMLN